MKAQKRIREQTGERIGIYGGTFDPIHHGHINLAIEMLEKHELTQIWFCPAIVNPFKQCNQPATTFQQRCEMLYLALENFPHCRVIDVAASWNSPSYTIDSLLWFIEEAERLQIPREFFILLGMDTAIEFPRWHRAEEIIQHAFLLVGQRAHDSRWEPALATAPSAIATALRQGMTQTRTMEISSTEIRQRLARAQYCNHLLPAKVVDYISNNRLYCTSK